MKIGESDIANVVVGDTPVKKIIYQDTVIWEQSSTETTSTNE